MMRASAPGAAPLCADPMDGPTATEGGERRPGWRRAGGGGGGGGGKRKGRARSDSR